MAVWSFLIIEPNIKLLETFSKRIDIQVQKLQAIDVFQLGGFFRTQMGQYNTAMFLVSSANIISILRKFGVIFQLIKKKYSAKDIYFLIVSTKISWFLTEEEETISVILNKQFKSNEEPKSVLRPAVRSARDIDYFGMYCL